MKNVINSIISMTIVIFVLTITPITTFAAFATEPVDLEEAWFPAETMNITQLAYESYSHGSQNAIDLVSAGNLVAPFTGKVVYVDQHWGYVVFQSVDKVRYANGDTDYMSVCFMHDEDISDMKNAYQNEIVIDQGTPIYQQGGMGNGNPNAYGDHVHLSVYRGKYGHPNTYGNGDVYPFDAFFINPKLTTNYSGRGEGYAVSGNEVYNNAPTNYCGLWKKVDYMAECISYISMATVVEISETTTFKTLPCSKKTCEDSLDIRNGYPGEQAKVIGLHCNSVGNYWYSVIVDGKLGYLFAGNAKMIQSTGDNEHYLSIDGYHLCKGMNTVN